MTRNITRQGDGGPPRQRELAEGPAGAEHPADPHPHTLADVDVRALDVPGVQFRLSRVPERARFVLVCSDDRGATELWMTDLDALPEHIRSIPSVREAGGVEIHSPTQDDPDDGGPNDCDLVPGGKCYSRGISLHGLQLPQDVWDGDSTAVLRELARRHNRAFGGDPR